MRRLAALRRARVRAEVPRVVCLIRFYFKRVPATSGPLGAGVAVAVEVLRFIRNNFSYLQCTCPRHRFQRPRDAAHR